MFKKLFLMLALVSSAGLIATVEADETAVFADEIEQPGKVKKAVNFLTKNWMVTAPAALLATWVSFTALSKSVYSQKKGFRGWFETAGYQVWHPWLTTKANAHWAKSFINGSRMTAAEITAAENALVEAAKLLSADTVAVVANADAALPAFAAARKAFNAKSDIGNLHTFVAQIKALDPKEANNIAAKDACKDLVAQYDKLNPKRLAKDAREKAYDDWNKGTDK